MTHFRLVLKFFLFLFDFYVVQQFSTVLAHLFIILHVFLYYETWRYFHFSSNICIKRVVFIKEALMGIQVTIPELWIVLQSTVNFLWGNRSTCWTAISCRIHFSHICWNVKVLFPYRYTTWFQSLFLDIFC